VHLLNVVLAEKTMRLSFGIKVLDELFSGFEVGDLAIMHGDAVSSILFLLAVRCQLSVYDGGLDSTVVFVDGGNSFRLFEVSEIAQLCGLDPAAALQRIFISRAFTAHQMTAIVMEKLEETVTKYNTKVVLVSDIAGLYLDRDVPTGEAKEVFVRVVDSLVKLAERHRLIIVSTAPPHKYSRRNAFCHAVVCGKADAAISIKKSKSSSGYRFILEKHPSLCLGRVDFPLQEFTIDQFV
jgi:hypothetical protein